MMVVRNQKLEPPQFASVAQLFGDILQQQLAKFTLQDHPLVGTISSRDLPMVDGKLKQVGKPQIGTPEMCAVDVLDRGQSTLLVGTGALKHETEFRERLNPVLPALEIADDKYSMPLASTLVEIAHERALRGEWVLVEEVVPLYLRAPDAEINWATRSAQ